MSHIRNTRPYHGGARSRPAIIDEIHDQWCRDNGYPVKSQASGNKSCKLQASGNPTSRKPQAQHELQASSIADHEHASSKPQA